MVPGIHGNVAAWLDLRNGGSDLNPSHSDVYMMDLSGPMVEEVVCDNPASQTGSLQVGEEFIVWSDTRNDLFYPNTPSEAENWDLYLNDLVTGEEKQVTDLLGRREHSPQIVNNRVYFVMVDDYDIYSIFEVTLPEYAD